MRSRELIANLREVIDLSRHCTSPGGGRIPTYAIKEGIERIEALEQALTLITEMDGDQPARSDWDMFRIARAALAKTTGAA